MAHRFVLVATGVASAASAVVNEWISIASGALAIALSTRQLYKLWRRRRHRPTVPAPPTPLPLGRVSKEDYARMLHAWEIYGAQIEQYFKDKKGQE